MQDQNVACRWTRARPSRNLASTRGDGKCRVDAHEMRGLDAKRIKSILLVLR